MNIYNSLSRHHNRNYAIQRACIRFTNSHSERDEDKKSYVKHGLLLVCPLTAFGLGYWQIERRKWKRALLDHIDKILPQPPIALPKDIKASTDLHEFQSVFVEGYFDHSREVIIGPRNIITDDISPGGYGSAWGSKNNSEKMSNLSNLGGPPPTGFMIVTPFRLKERPDTWILVNRGWVPMTNRDPIRRKNGQVEGLTTLTGCIRYDETPYRLVPDPKPVTCIEVGQQDHQHFFCREVNRIAHDLNTLPVFLDANYESSVRGGPIGGQTRIQIRNDHTQYIIIWFSLGTITLGMWIYWLLF